MVSFMSSTAGRWTRGVIGLALIGAGVATGGAGWALAAVGTVFVGVGVGDVCLLAPLFGKPLKGRDVRAAL
ncbi:DUF2892 domain-containing protein [Demequina salsinemoris]|uniref:DUF2892 domain-containing protein n=1 Tax=Demequina salsinemoris TaxID=577470 RepID=UPI000785C743|nr:DUF2892 domain-containing protein [Demequina salsinemoris]